MKHILLYENWNSKKYVLLQNNIITKLFKKFGIKIRIYGIDDKAFFIVDNKQSLSCYAKSGSLNFTMGYNPSDIKNIKKSDRIVIAQLRLDNDIEKIELEGFDIKEWYNGVKHREVFTIERNIEGLIDYYAGEVNGKKIFDINIDRSKIFFSEINVKEAIDELNKFGFHNLNIR